MCDDIPRVTTSERPRNEGAWRCSEPWLATSRSSPGRRTLSKPRSGRQDRVRCVDGFTQDEILLFLIYDDVADLAGRHSDDACEDPRVRVVHRTGGRGGVGT